MAITQSLYLTGAVQYGIKQIAETIQHMICTERVIEYTNLEQVCFNLNLLYYNFINAVRNTVQKSILNNFINILHK